MEIIDNTVRKRRMKWYLQCVHIRPIGCPKQRRMDYIGKDLKKADLELYGITTEQNRFRLEELVEDRER